MAITYLEITISLQNELHDMAAALLGDINYDSFAEEDNCLKAYIDKSVFSEEELKDQLDILPQKGIVYEVGELENINWNKKWEENFDPVEINDQCIIKASFHNIEKKYAYEIIINPKMSFGTGHHATTALMVENLLKLDVKGKSLFDAGTGTGILAVLAKKLGASTIHSCDIDDWSFGNAQENFELNDASDIKIVQGVFKDSVSESSYDVILANINKNVLLEEIKEYSSKLKEKSYLVLSGFYQHDVEDIAQKASEHNLKQLSMIEKSNWVSVVFQKIA